MLRASVPEVSENERDEPKHESFEGEDLLLGGPALSRDPYTPEPGPRPGEQRAFTIMRWAWVPILVIALLLLVAIFR
jgi:hypothetical protein